MSEDAVDAAQSRPETVAEIDLSEEPVSTPPRRGRTRQVLLTSLLVLVIVLLAGGAGAGLYYRSVALPSVLTFPGSTTLYYADGQTVMARLGEVNRFKVPIADMVDGPKLAAVAAADPDFYSGKGGPIARSVSRSAFERRGDGLSARARSAVLALKLDGSYSKEQILEMYLNNSSFGRRTFGIEAAAREYFGKTADKTATDVESLTMSEAMALVVMLSQPEPDPADPEGSPGYDPTRGAKAAANATSGWNSVRDAMVSAGSVSRTQADALSYPTVRPYDPNAQRSNLDRPTGLVVNHVLSELSTGPGPFHGMSWKAIRDGGYKIVTTIQAPVQEALEKKANATVPDSVMAGQPANLGTAAVLVEPGTGRVLGYYGGSGGAGADLAGVYVDEKGERAGFGAHRPGHAFAVHALAAALKAGVSLNSYWQWTPHDMPGRTGSNRLANQGTCPTAKDRSGACSLLDSTLASLNVPFYGLTTSVTAAKVLEMARDAGVTAMWDDLGKRQDLTGAASMAELAPSKFDTILGIGVYPVTVLDQANAMATYAAGGLRAQAHFVTQVTEGGKALYSERLPDPGQPRILSSQAIADLSYALSQVQAAKLTGRDSAGKTGYWAFSRVDPNSGRIVANQNSDAWMVGYTSKLAMAVWIGDRTGQYPIKDASGAPIFGAGLPATIYRDVMNDAHDALRLTPAPFAPPVFGGTVNPPGAVPS